MTEQCVEILTAYRTNCASSTSPGQLILPEAFKLLPIYIHSSIRSKALRGGKKKINLENVLLSEICFYLKKLHYIYYSWN